MNDTLSNPAEISDTSETKTAAPYPALRNLGIEYRDEIKGKPVFVVHSNSVISLDSHFKQKKLCDGPTFTTGHACVFSCEFCYVKSVLRKNQKVNAILKESGLAFEDIVIELASPATVARKFLSGKSKPKFNDPKDQRVIYASPLVDIAATMDHVQRTVEVCLAILELTNWHIRLLSKSNLLRKVAERIPDEYKGRMIYGFSTGTLDDGLAKIFEKGTAYPSKRLDALHWLQNNGYRTFGMPCPTLPQRDYDEFAVRMAEAIRVDRCEHVWVEVLNPRGDSLPGTAKALREAGQDWQADQLELVAKNKAAFEDYSRKTFEAFVKVVPADKLRFMQYVTKDSYQWWKDRGNKGAIVLGAHVNRLTGPRKALADPLTEEEKKLWAECQKEVRRNFKTCLSAYVQLGKFLAKIRDQRLYREDFKSFEIYCRKELEIARSTAYGYISDYQVSMELSEISDTSKITKEIHLRPIVTLQEPERQQAMELLKSKAGIEPLTPELLKGVAAEVIAKRSSTPLGPTELAVQVPAVATTAVAETRSGQEAIPLTGFINTMRLVVREAVEACPEHRILIAKELRDLAATLEVPAI